MENAVISFPILGDIALNPPSSFKLFNFTFYIYGLVIATGFLLAVIYCTLKCRKFSVNEDNFFDALLFSVPAGIIGARVYYVVFNFSNFAGDWTSVFKIREGGLAIYGGIIFSVLTALIVCRRKKIPIASLLDTASFGFLIGQCIGRWGNFFNREAFGPITDSLFRMGLTLPGFETMYVHPTFLYESLWNLVGFVAMHIYSVKRERLFEGQYFLSYVAWYGLGRMFIEGLRSDSLFIPGTSLRVSQLVAAASFIAAVVAIHYFAKRAKSSNSPGQGLTPASDGELPHTGEERT